MAWEYKTIELEMDSSSWSGKSNFPKGQELEAQLNGLGLQGWELVSAITSSESLGHLIKILFIFKRSHPQ